MAVLAIFNILSANPMVTTLDAVLDAFRPPERERDRVDKRPAPPDDHEDLADRDRDAGREARQSTRLRKNMPTQEWRGPRAAAVPRRTGHSLQSWPIMRVTLNQLQHIADRSIVMRNPPPRHTLC